jgi:hypothetical protein
VKAGFSALVAALALGAAACGGGNAEPASSGSTASSSTGTAPSLTMTPPVVRAGDVLSLEGAADGCPAGDTVSLLSKAFPPGHDFAGVPAVDAQVGSDGSFSVTTTIPASTAPGRYEVTGRCGGGNLGFLEHLTVRR